MFALGNKKLHKSIAIWSLPSGRNNICGRTCSGCYAIANERLRPIIKHSREKNFILSKSPEFVRLAEEELKRLLKFGIKWVRVHEGGEFYSEEYTMKWLNIALRLPCLTFFAYTKRMDIAKRLRDMPNFVLFNSEQYGPLNYFEKEEITPGKFPIVCAAGKGVMCGTRCTYCMKKENEDKCPVFIKH